jgi:hypothetical protein
VPDLSPSEEGRLTVCPRCGWKNPAGRPGCSNPKCSRYLEVPPRANVFEKYAPWPALGIAVLALVLIVWAIVASMGPDPCEEWDRQVAEQITILQEAYPSLDFFEANQLAEEIVGPAPTGC